MVKNKHEITQIWHIAFYDSSTNTYQCAVHLETFASQILFLSDGFENNQI